MSRLLRNVLPICTALALTACGSIPTKTFEFRAINFEGNPVPCLVVVDRNLNEAIEKKTYTDCTVTIPFKQDRMFVKVLPTHRGSDGEIIPPDGSENFGEYYTESRDLAIDDPRLHLFILRYNPDYSGN